MRTVLLQQLSISLKGQSQLHWEREGKALTSCPKDSSTAQWAAGSVQPLVGDLFSYCASHRRRGACRAVDDVRRTPGR
jgi:hypothetical protein